MTKYQLEIHGRFLKRTFERAIGRSLLKILAETITNSDDSYKRLKSQEKKKQKSIKIIADKKKRIISVIDQAEGFTQKEMVDKLVTYGGDSGDSAKGFKTRSLFGKGLRDVLFTQDWGHVKSIKNKKCAIAKFRWRGKRGENKKPEIDITHGPRVKPDFRKALGIKENGTRVDFKLRKDITFPQHETLCEKVRNFYMLRYINSNPQRRITVQTIGKKDVETIIKFNWPTGQQIIKKEHLIELDALEFPVKIEIFRADTELSQGEAGVEDRIGGLLIFDESNNVLDLTLFKYDKDPSATYLFGKVEINGVGDYIRTKLNQNPPEEVLTETRDGFNKKHKFYKKLASLIEPIIEPIVQEEERRRKRSEGTFSEKTQIKLEKALELLNKLYEELVGKADVGDEFKGRNPFIPEVLSFIREELTITEGVETPIALLVNVDAVPDGTEVKLESSSEKITINPTDFVVKHDNAQNKLLMKVIRLTSEKAGITGIISAEVPQGKTSVIINVIQQNIYYPIYGLDFKPQTLNLYDEKKRNLHLYVDCDKVPIGSSIEIFVDDRSFTLDENIIELKDKNNISSSIALLDIPIIGRGIGNKGIITAVYENLSANAFVQIVDRKKRRPRTQKGARFKQPKFEEIPQLKRQTFLNSEGAVVINMVDLLNKRYFGTDPYQAIEQKLHCQTRLADLMLDECLYEIVIKAWGRTLEKRFPDDPATDIRAYVANKKFEVGPAFHDAFVTLLEESELTINQDKVVRFFVQNNSRERAKEKLD